MYIFLIVLHVIASLVLIATILLQAGKGGGLSEMFESGSVQSILGTSSAAFLKKFTAICAVIFLTTSLTLAIYSSRRARSLMDRVRVVGGAMETTPRQVPAPAGHNDTQKAQ